MKLHWMMFTFAAAAFAACAGDKGDSDTGGDAADADAMIDPAAAAMEDEAGLTVTVIVPRNPRSQTFSKRDRRSWFRSLKNL